MLVGYDLITSRKPEGPKRQRTTSGSPTPPRELARFASQPESEDDTKPRSGSGGGAKKIRGAAARNHREKELREERERLRMEAANKRKGRAERRRVGGMSRLSRLLLPMTIERYLILCQ